MDMTPKAVIVGYFDERMNRVLLSGLPKPEARLRWLLSGNRARCLALSK